MDWLWYIIIGVFLGGIIFNKKMRKAVFHFIGQLIRSEHKSANFMSRRRKGESVIIRQRDGSEEEIDFGDDYDEE